MTLNTLALTVDAGVQGHGFAAAVRGLTPGTMVELTDATPGMGYENGIVYHPALPYDLNFVELRERVPTTGENRTTRLLVPAMTEEAIRALAVSSVSNAQSFRVAAVNEADGSVTHRVFIMDENGGTTSIPLNGSIGPALQALSLSTALTSGTAVSGAIGGATNGSTIASNIPGVAVDSAARTYSGTPTGGAQTIANGLVETLAGATNSPRSTAVTVAAASLSGFALNGSSNPALKAMLARVAGGTGRGKIVHKGDSTTIGQGAGMTTGTSSDPMVQGASAALYRPSAVLASQLANIGYPALDMGFVGSNGTGSSTGNTEWLNYDPRLTYEGGQLTLNFSQDLAGGAFFNNGTGDNRVLDFTPTIACDRYEIVFYNTSGSLGFAVGQASASGFITASGGTVSGNTVTSPGTSSGFTRVLISMPSATSDALRIVGNSGMPLLRSTRSWNSAVKAVDILNHASGGASSTNQSKSSAGSGNWSNLEALAFDAPDLTVINLGLNDVGAGITPSTYSTNLGALIDAAKVSGDVLLVSPHPASPSFSATASQIALRDAASALAASKGVAYMDLYTYFGSWAAIASRSVDGLVHLNRGGYAEVGQVYRQCIQAMAA